MFTGIVEECGKVVATEPNQTGARIRVSATFCNELAKGESVAVNGVCLTVTEVDESGAMCFDLLNETLKVTNLEDLKSEDAVNLERALRVGDRLSGHFVQGHVDDCAQIIALEESGADHRLQIELPARFQHLVVHKGSVCVNGISLTIAELEEESFTLWIIPHTYEVTNLHALGVGARVNLEFDLLAKHLARIEALRGEKIE